MTQPLILHLWDSIDFAALKRRRHLRVTLAARDFRVPLRKSACRLLAWVFLLSQVAIAQSTMAEKPCIAFSPQSTSSTNAFAKDPLQSAVMASGDLDFYPSQHDGCWVVHVLSLPINSAKGKNLGYVVSQTVTDPQGLEVGHALTFGPDRDIFVPAMNKAAADAIRNIRLSRPTQDSH